MTRKKPFVSVIIPTRNRPELVKYALMSMQAQTFTDFEVIVSDNHTGRPCKEVFDRFADERFSYTVPSTPLPMHDNWEFACSFARGDYITVLIDKTVLRPLALQTVCAAAARYPAEIISWWNENYVPVNVDCSYDEGTYQTIYKPRSKPLYFDPNAELRRRFEVDIRRGTEGVNYFWGKICFGAYRRDLVQRIRNKLGRLFYPLAPDYTSMLAALAYTNNAVDIGLPLLISFQTELSNGTNAAIHPEHALRFIGETDPSLQILDSFPIRGLYMSHHNAVAHDYLLMKEKVGGRLQRLELNLANLILRAREDLYDVVWQDISVKKRHFQIISSYYRMLPYRKRFEIKWNYGRYLCMRMASKIFARQLYRQAKLKIIAASLIVPQGQDIYQFGPIKTYKNVIEAARASDSYYSHAGHEMSSAAYVAGQHSMSDC